MIAGLVLLFYFFKIPCLFQAFLHIPCPGCGMTRAYISLLHLDFRQAFMWNPMFWSIPVLLIFYFFDGKIFKSNWINTVSITLIFGGFFICWLWKLF